MMPRDAEAIAETFVRPTMRFAPIKSVDQQAAEFQRALPDGLRPKKHNRPEETVLEEAMLTVRPYRGLRSAMAAMEELMSQSPVFNQTQADE